MPQESDADKLARGWVMHDCGNVIDPQSAHCPLCKRFNHATNAENCTLCGQVLPKSSGE